MTWKEKNKTKKMIKKAYTPTSIESSMKTGAKMVEDNVVLTPERRLSPTPLRLLCPTRSDIFEENEIVQKEDDSGDKRPNTKDDNIRIVKECEKEK